MHQIYLDTYGTTVLTSFVIVSRHPRRSIPFRHCDEKQVAASPLDSAFTNCDARNSFRIRFCENCRVSYHFVASLTRRETLPHTKRISKPLVFYSLHTLPSSVSRNSFVCRSYENCRVYANDSHSETPHLPLTTSILADSFHALTNCPPHNPFLLTFMHRMGGIGVPPRCPQFVSQPYICLLNYLDPIFPGAGPAERSLVSRRGQGAEHEQCRDNPKA